MYPSLAATCATSAYDCLYERTCTSCSARPLPVGSSGLQTRSLLRLDSLDNWCSPFNYVTSKKWAFEFTLIIIFSLPCVRKRFITTLSSEILKEEFDNRKRRKKRLGTLGANQSEWYATFTIRSSSRVDEEGLADQVMEIYYYYYYFFYFIFLFFFHDGLGQ